MMESHPTPDRRTIRVTDSAELDRLEAAWSELEDSLAHGETASQLDVEDLDRLICDLVAIRHRKLSGGASGDRLTTVVTEPGDATIVLETNLGGDVADDFCLSGSH